MNWRGTPLVDLNTIVSLIGSTHSRAGLHLRAELDRGRYPAGITVTDAQMATIQLTRHRFHGIGTNRSPRDAMTALTVIL